MKVQLTESGPWRRTLDIEVPPEDVENRLAEAYRTYSKSLNIPGFRKGKVPLGMVKARFGQVILDEVLQKVEEETYREATVSEGLQPVAEATIEDRSYSADAGLRFKASVDVRPTPEVGGYRELKVTRPVFKVEESHVDERLFGLQTLNATEQAADRPLQLGDVLVADIQEVDGGGLPIVGRKQEGQTFWVGAPRDTNHDLDNQLVGIAVAEQRQVRLTRTPPETDAAGEEVRFEVTAKEVRERTLPALDDEFAKDLGEFESLEALKARIREDLQTQADAVSRRRLQENIVDGLIRENDFELPESMVSNFLDNLVEAYKRENEAQEIDEAAVREQNREAAVRNVRRYILLERIGEQESIKVTEEDVEARLGELAGRYNTEASRLKQIYDRSGQLGRLESDLFDERIFDFLIESASIEDVEEVAAEDA